jgi:hypothetical protein
VNELEISAIKIQEEGSKIINCDFEPFRVSRLVVVKMSVHYFVLFIVSIVTNGD